MRPIYFELYRTNGSSVFDLDGSASSPWSESTATDTVIRMNVIADIVREALHAEQ